MADDDARLVRAAIRGDEDAFRTLVERYTGMCAGMAYAVTGDAEAARDIAQEAFCDAYRNLRRLRSAKKFAGWLAGISRRKAVSWVRGRARRRVEYVAGQGEFAQAAAPAPGEEAERDEVRGRVLAAVRGLPPGYREVIVLRCLEERPHAEICGVLGIGVAALDKRLARAKAMLREVLGDLAGEYGSPPAGRPESEAAARPEDGGGAEEGGKRRGESERRRDGKRRREEKAKSRR